MNVKSRSYLLGLIHIHEIVHASAYVKLLSEVLIFLADWATGYLGVEELLAVLVIV